MYFSREREVNVLLNHEIKQRCRIYEVGILHVVYYLAESSARNRVFPAVYKLLFSSDLVDECACLGSNGDAVWPEMDMVIVMSVCSNAVRLAN